MTTYTAEQIEALGGKRWAKDGRIRYYLDESVWAPMVGLEVDRYSTGNVRRATLAGEKISNAKATAAMRAKVYWEDGQLWIVNGAEIDAPLRAAIDAAVAPVAEPEPEPVVAEPVRRAAAAVPLDFMVSLDGLVRREAARGPRWQIHATVRPGEYCAGYAATAESADATRAWLEQRGYRQIKIVPPDGSVDLAALGRERSRAKAALDEATALLRAGAFRALEAGRSEVEVAAAAGIDRQTLRAWSGKQPSNR